MSWLNDIEDKWRKERAKNAAERRARENRRELYRQLFSAKYRHLDSIVTRLLNDLGKAYWGARHYKFSRDSRSWKIYSGYYFWQVSLSTNLGEEDFISATKDDLNFSIHIMSKRSENIVDISENSLKAALRTAAEAGPYEQEVDG